MCVMLIISALIFYSPDSIQVHCICHPLQQPYQYTYSCGLLMEKLYRPFFPRILYCKCRYLHAVHIVGNLVKMKSAKMCTAQIFFQWSYKTTIIQNSRILIHAKLYFLANSRKSIHVKISMSTVFPISTKGKNKINGIWQYYPTDHCSVKVHGHQN